ncbi:MAG: YfcE family phosphodiesterase [Patescibacteria group bacterium]|jgi:hypothetical protein
MLIAIISDIHDNLINLKKCLSWCNKNKIKKIIFCGDLTTSETAAFLAANFSGNIFITKGNAEIYFENDLKSFQNIIYCHETETVKIENIKIGICHEPEKIKLLLKKQPHNPDFIFYGHTHKPWIAQEGGTIIANPGNLSNTFHQATFATLNTADKKLKLKILADL